MTGNHCAFNFYFALIWGAVDLAVPGIVVLLYLSVRRIVDNPDGVWADPWDVAILLAAAAALLFYTVVMRRHTPRVLVRAGVWPGWCRPDDRYPTTVEELEEAIKELHAKNPEQPPTIVGAGWGFFLQRKGPTGARVFTHKCGGLEDDAWRPGTTIASIAKHYKKQNLSLISHPTMDYISAGAWFANGNHGNGGSSKEAVNKILKTAKVLRLKGANFEKKDVTAEELLEYVYEDRRYPDRNTRTYVLSITLDATSGFVPYGRWLQKRGVEVRGFSNDADAKEKTGCLESLQATSHWLSDGAHLRVMFFGAARNYGFGLVWTDVYNEAETHIDPHFGSTFGQYVQTDNCSAVGGCREPLRCFRGKIKWGDANHWMPQLYPIETVAALVLGYINFETIVELPTPLNAAELCRVAGLMIEIHKKVGGRSELRQNARPGSRVIYLDWAIRSGMYEEVFKFLKSKLQVANNRVALHMGKHQHSAEDIQKWSKLTLVGMHEILARDA